MSLIHVKAVKVFFHPLIARPCLAATYVAGFVKALPWRFGEACPKQVVKVRPCLLDRFGYFYFFGEFVDSLCCKVRLWSHFFIFHVDVAY